MDSPDNSRQVVPKISFFEERTVKWNSQNQSVVLIDQSRLPSELRYIECTKVAELVDAIKSLKIRGAPAIGVAGAMGVALAILSSHATSKAELLQDIQRECDALKEARPTAINLTWGVDQVLNYLKSATFPQEWGKAEIDRVVAFVESLADKDVSTNKQLSEYGQKLFHSGDKVLTHCN